MQLTVVCLFQYNSFYRSIYSQLDSLKRVHQRGHPSIYENIIAIQERSDPKFSVNHDVVDQVAIDIVSIETDIDNFGEIVDISS